MNDVEWLGGNRIKVHPPTRPKKITGTRFGAVLGVNRWNTPFNAWCVITRTYEEPFEDTIYTIAGKAIEPKQAEYIKNMGLDIISPTDVYGENYFKKTYGDFFAESPIFSGMWDYLGVDENGKVDTVYEMKTSKRVEDWQTDIPEYYALQAALYAYLLGVENVVVVASFLTESDYQDPDKYECSTENTVTREFRVHERYPDFEEKINTATKWWNEHVLTGVSPVYDEKKDADILKVLRTTELSPDEVRSLIGEAETLKTDIDKVTETISSKEKRLKEINDILKKIAVKNFKPGDKKVIMSGDEYTWSFSKSSRTSVDTDKLKQDGLLEKYQKVSDSYRLTISKKKMEA